MNDAASHTGSTANGDDAPDSFDATAAAAALASGDRIGRRFQVSPTVLFSVWGLAWIVGFGALYLSARDAAPINDPLFGLPADSAFPVFNVAFLLAGVVTLFYVVRSSVGVRGKTALIGTLFGISWPVVLGAVFLFVGALGGLGLTPQQLATVLATLPTMAVGMMYIAGGLAFREVSWWAVGGWITISGGAATYLGVPDSYLAVALAGGVGFIAGAIASALTRRRQ